MSEYDNMCFQSSPDIHVVGICVSYPSSPEVSVDNNLFPLARDARG